MKVIWIITATMLAVAVAEAESPQSSVEAKKGSEEKTDTNKTADINEASENNAGFKFLNFRIAPVGASHSGGESYSVSFSWNPEYRFQPHPEWSLGLNLGWIWFENQDRSDFQSFELQPIIGYRFTTVPVGAELGVGVQYWTEARAGTYTLLSGNGFYEFKQKIFNLMDRVFIGYSGFFLPQSFTHEIKIGVGLSF